MRRNLLKITLLSALAALPLAAQTPPKTTDVLVMLTIKPGIAREQVMKVMTQEIKDTVRLYLDGKIRQWFSRGDGRGVVFILNAKDVAEAHAIMDELPLAKENLADYEFTPLAPLNPLRVLIGDAPAKP
jgi:hypothetical protein